MPLKSSFFLLLTVIAPFFLHAQFRTTYLATDSTNEINAVQFLTPAEGYVCFNRWIGYTQDSGHSFQQKPITLSNVDYNGYSVNLTFGFTLNGVYAFTRDSLLAYGHYGFVPSVLFSSNGGTSFKLIYNNTLQLNEGNPGIIDMVFPGQGSTGYAIEANRVLKSTNRGMSWFPVLNDVNTFFRDMTFFSTGTGYLISNDKLLTTANGGSSWQSLVPPAGQLQSVHFTSPSKGWLTTGGLVYATTNSGATWSLKNNGQYFPAGDKVHFINDSAGYTIAGLFTILKTTDSGKIWEPLPRDNNFSYLGYSHNKLFFLNTDHIWAGGGHGFLEHSSNGGGISLPLARFSADLSFLNIDGSVRLKNYSKQGYQYTWLVNGVVFASSYDASYLSARTGMDTVTLIVKKGLSSDTSSFEFYTKADPQPCSAAFQSVVDSGTVKCTPGYLLAGVKHLWDFGDGTKDSINSNPVHTYASAGVFSIRHNVFNSITGCKDSVARSVTVLRTHSCLLGNFTYKTDSFYTNRVYLTPVIDRTQDMLWYNNSISWDYGDASFVQTGNAHIYPAAGFYNTCLTTTNQNTGCSSRFCKPIQVIMNDTCNASFRVETPSSNFGGIFLLTHDLAFNSALHTRKAGKRHTWVINNADSVVAGNSESTRYSFYRTSAGSPYGSFANGNSGFCEGYQTAEICIDSLQKLVTHIVYDSLSGCTASSSRTLEVQRMQNAWIQAIPDPKFPWTVTLKAFARIGANDSVPMNTVWGIAYPGSGPTSYGTYIGIVNQLRNFQFTQPGDYRISITALACISNIKEVYYIHYNVPAVNCAVYPPDFSFTVPDTANTKRLGFTIDQTALNANLQLNNNLTWYWGDGDSSVNGSPVHSYANYGDYTVTLKYTGAGGCSKQVSHLVAVRPKCTLTAGFVLVRDAVTGARISFTSSSSPVTSNTRYTWRFGNGDSSVLANPVYQYKKTGTYKITLLVLNDAYCFASRDTTVIITATDSCSLKSNFAATVALNNVQVTNLATPSSAAIKYNWNFGDSSAVNTGLAPGHSYLKAGNYTVCLQSALDAACSSVFCKTVSVTGLGQQVLKITPNPVTGIFTASYLSELDETVTLSIVDNRGQVIRSSTQPAFAGINSYPLSSGDLKPGWYVLRVTGNAGKKATARFLKL